MAKLKTGKHTSPKREARRALKHKRVNDSWNAKIKSISKKVALAVGRNDRQKAKELLSEAFRLYDRAAKKKAIHANKAANQKSRLAVLCNKAFKTA